MEISHEGMEKCWAVLAQDTLEFFGSQESADLELIIKLVLANTIVENLCELSVVSKGEHHNTRCLVRWCLRVDTSTPRTLWPPPAAKPASRVGFCTIPSIERIVWGKGVNLDELGFVPDTVKSLSFGTCFDERLQGVNLPGGLRN